MTIRPSIQDFIAAGPLPGSDTASPEEVRRIQELLEVIPEPVSDEEAQALVHSFGPDTAFGLAWELMHKIETAPGAMTAHYPELPGAEGFWTERLNARVANAEEDEDG